MQEQHRRSVQLSILVFTELTGHQCTLFSFQDVATKLRDKRDTKCNLEKKYRKVSCKNAHIIQYIQCPYQLIDIHC